MKRISLKKSDLIIISIIGAVLLLVGIVFLNFFLGYYAIPFIVIGFILMCIGSRGIIGSVVNLVVGIILVSFGIILTYCCSRYLVEWGPNPPIWFIFVRYMAGDYILLGIGGALIGLGLIGILYSVWKSRRKG
jgi:hypothetical protein